MGPLAIELAGVPGICFTKKRGGSETCAGVRVEWAVKLQ